METTANARWSDWWLKSLCDEGRKQELCDGVNDVEGVIRGCRRDRHSRAADPDADGGTNCRRAADLHRPTAGACDAGHDARDVQSSSSASDETC